MKYTIKNFKADFPDDKTCLAFIFKNRYPKGLACPKCDVRKGCDASFKSFLKLLIKEFLHEYQKESTCR